MTSSLLLRSHTSHYYRLADSFPFRHIFAVFANLDDDDQVGVARKSCVTKFKIFTYFQATAHPSASIITCCNQRIPALSAPVASRFSLLRSSAALRDRP